MKNINSGLVKSRTQSLFFLGITFVMALLAGFWMAVEPKKDPSPQSLNPEAHNHNQVLKVRQSASQVRLDLAMKESKSARAFISLPQPDKRIEYLHEQSLILSPKDFHTLLDAASADLSRSVRLEAISLLNSTFDQQFRIEYLISMVQDNDPVVRDIAFQAVNEMEVAERIKVLSQVLTSEDPTIVLKSANTLAAYGTKSSAEAIYLQLISNHNANVSQKLLQSFGRSIGKKFESVDLAVSWWGENKNKYNEDLSLVDGM